MRFAVSPRELQRLLRRMGLNVKAEELKATRVVVELEDGSELVVEPQQAMILDMGGQVLLNVLGSLSEVREARGEAGGGEEIRISEEDVRLVAEQAGVSLEEARRALIEAKGDLAAAIMKLMEGKRGG